MFIITRTAGGTRKTHFNELVIEKKGVSYNFLSYIHSLCELNTFSQKSLRLNNVTFVIYNVIQVALLGWETDNIVMYF